jgi:hypothetical protein
MITTLNDKWIAVNCPDHTGEVVVRSTEHCNASISFFDKFTNNETIVILPPGSYTFCFLWPEGVTEQWAEKIVKRYGNCYMDYTAVKGGLAAHSLSAVASFQTALQSKGLDLNKNYAICQKKN